MKSIQDYYVITPGDLHWRSPNLMQIQNVDYLERTESENLADALEVKA